MWRPDTGESTNVARGQAISVQDPGFWLASCRRLSLALSAGAGIRRLWASVSRVMRQYWAGRIQSEVWAAMPGGPRLPVRLWDHVEAGIFWYGFPAEDLAAYRVLCEALPRDGVLLDVGANIGAFTLPLAIRLDRGTVHGFEPASGTVARLRRNLQINQIDNVVVNQCAVSDRSGPLSIWIPDKQWKGRLYNTGRTSAYVGRRDSGWREETVAGVTLDEYTGEHRLHRVDAIKIDVEGGELDVLQGARTLIRRFQPMVVMEVNRGPLEAAGRSIDDVLGFWEENGYTIGTIAGNGTITWQPPSRTSADHRNLCCVPARLDNHDA